MHFSIQNQWPLPTSTGPHRPPETAIECHANLHINDLVHFLIMRCKFKFIALEVLRKQILEAAIESNQSDVEDFELILEMSIIYGHVDCAFFVSKVLIICFSKHSKFERRPIDPAG